MYVMCNNNIELSRHIRQLIKQLLKDFYIFKTFAKFNKTFLPFQ